MLGINVRIVATGFVVGQAKHPNRKTRTLT
jgi:hypothetical protein